MTPLAAIFCFALLSSSEAVAGPQVNDEPVPHSTIKEDVRGAFFIHGNRAFKSAVENLIQLPLGEEVELVPGPTFRRAALKARLRSGPTIPTAQALAHTLLLSHAVSVSSASKLVRGERRAFIEVLVVRLRPKTTVSMAKIFVLPGHKLTPALAHTIVDRIKKAIAASAGEEGAASTDEESQVGQGPFAEGHKGMSPDADEEDADNPPADGQASASGYPAINLADGQHRLRMRLGLGATQRAAAVNASADQPTAPTYGGADATNLEPSVSLELAIFTGGGSAFGLRANGIVQLARTHVTDPEENVNIVSWVRQIDGTATFRWRTAIGLDLAPEVGFGLYQFPIHGGSFPGLTYTSPLAGIRLGHEGNTWHGWVSGNVLFLLRVGDEAARLGALSQALGGVLEVGNSWTLGDAVDLGLLLRFEQINSTYTGQTFLFSAQRWTNVGVSDRLLQAFITVGSQFW